jgi:hypothetical protein
MRNLGSSESKGTMAPDIVDLENSFSMEVDLAD